MEDQSKWLKSAYHNIEFLDSPEARSIRILSELIEPRARFREHHVKNTIVFFGSARTLPPDVAKHKLEQLSKEDKGYQQAYMDHKMSKYYQAASDLAFKITKWSMEIKNPYDKFYVCSGGGPGIMEAANRGASEAGGESVGFNISLPFEQNGNEYQTKKLAFEFHYFFIRKFWFFYLSKAMVVFPGGYGTLDELFELLTLVQTKKTKKYMPTIIFGKEYWNELIDFDVMLKWGVISKEDLDLFHFFDDVDEAFDFLKGEMLKHYLI